MVLQIKRFFLVVVSLMSILVLSGCGDLETIDDISLNNNVGEAVAAIKEVPDDVQCISIEYKNDRHSKKRNKDVIPGNSDTIILKRITSGETEFSASAYNSSCEDVNENSISTWEAEPAKYNIVAGTKVLIQLVLTRRGEAEVEMDFADDISSECTYGERRCWGNINETCDPSGNWIVREVCSVQCLNGSCISSGPQPCDSGSGYKYNNTGTYSEADVYCGYSGAVRSRDTRNQLSDFGSDYCECVPAVLTHVFFY